MPLARKLRAAKPQVRRASRYCASEWSFQPGLRVGEAGAHPLADVVEADVRGRHAAVVAPSAGRRWSCPRRPGRSAARRGSRRRCRARRAARAAGTGPPGGSWTWPVAVGKLPVPLDGAGPGGAGGGTGPAAGWPGGGGGAPGARRPARGGTGGPPGLPCGSPRARAADPGGGGSGAPTACCIRCHSVSCSVHASAAWTGRRTVPSPAATGERPGSPARVPGRAGAQSGGSVSSARARRASR